MHVLKNVGETIGLIHEALQLFVDIKVEKGAYVAPFILYHGLDDVVMFELEEFSEPAIIDAVKKANCPVHGFVLAGDTQLLNPKTGKDQHFFVVKLAVDGLENCFVYSVPFSPDNYLGEISKLSLQYAGSEPNTFFKATAHQGEVSSLSAIKMEDKAPYHYRAAFLIGHFNEERLWSDTLNFMAEIYCKFAPDTTHRYDFVFEVSKFGQMTGTMVSEFKRMNAFFSEEFEPLFEHIDGEMKFENTDHSVHPS